MHNYRLLVGFDIERPVIFEMKRSEERAVVLEMPWAEERTLKGVCHEIFDLQFFS